MLSLCIPKIYMHIKNMVLSLKLIYKRVSFPSSFLLKGSMALEGCLVLPIFLFYMITLLYSLEIVRFQSDTFAAMHQAGSRAGVYTYAGTDTSETASEIWQYMGNQSLPYLCVAGGESGFHIQTRQNYLGKGNLQIEVSYTIKPFIYWLPIGDISVQDSCFLHGFVGYTGDIFTGDEGVQERYVYITPSGTKYHLSEHCTYLRVQIQAVDAESLAELRNASSEIYRACEVCRPQAQGICYLTKWGNRYHRRSDCTALKRTVYLVPISQVNRRTACSKCG